MGYATHLSFYPGPSLTENDSNLCSDPNEPLRAGLDHMRDVQTIDYLTFHGVPSDRILLGFPAITATYHGVTQPGTQGGLYQPFDRSQRFLHDAVGAYRDILEL